MTRLLPILGLVVLLASGASALDADVAPYSNSSSDVAVSTAVTPAAVAVSSTTPTRIDAAVNAGLLSTLGATYKRYSIMVQVRDPAELSCGYSTAVTTSAASGFRYVVNADPIEHKLGRNLGIYCQGIVSTGTVIVGGIGWK